MKKSLLITSLLLLIFSPLSVLSHEDPCLESPRADCPDHFGVLSKVLLSVNINLSEIGISHGDKHYCNGYVSNNGIENEAKNAKRCVENPAKVKKEEAEKKKQEREEKKKWEKEERERKREERERKEREQVLSCIPHLQPSGTCRSIQ